MPGDDPDGGFATVEFALVLPTLVGAVLLLSCLAGAVADRVACAAAAAAGVGVLDDGGDRATAARAAAAAAPPGAQVSVRALGGGMVEVRVLDRVSLPGWGRALVSVGASADAVVPP
jgi:hypothetical protein